MKHQVEFGLLTEHQESGREIIRLATLAESLGYGSYWVAEDPFYRGPYVTAATIAAHTKTMKIGTAVTNPLTRHPVVMAQEWAALDDFSEGRAVLGISAGGSILSEMFSLPRKKPLTMVKEAVEIIERLIAGEAVEYDGEVFQLSSLKNVDGWPHNTAPRLTIPSYRQKIPIYLGAQGPKSLQYCGEHLDGLIIAGGASVNEIALANLRKNIRIGANKSGRDVREVELPWLMTLYISDDDEMARRDSKQYIANKLVNEVSLVEALGRRLDLMCEQWGLETSYIDELVGRVKKGGNPVDLVTDEVVDSFIVSGSPERCKEQIKTLVERGITEFVLTDMTPYIKPLDCQAYDIEPSMKLFADKVIPEFL